MVATWCGCELEVCGGKVWRFCGLVASSFVPLSSLMHNGRVMVVISLYKVWPWASVASSNPIPSSCVSLSVNVQIANEPISHVYCSVTTAKLRFLAGRFDVAMFSLLGSI